MMERLGVEEPLRGGNASAGVVRVGDTVSRPAGPHTPAVHALLLICTGSGFGTHRGRWASTTRAYSLRSALAGQSKVPG
jgi:hypothetical protein